MLDLLSILCNRFSAILAAGAGAGPSVVQVRMQELLCDATRCPASRRSRTRVPARFRQPLSREFRSVRQIGEGMLRLVLEEVRSARVRRGQTFACLREPTASVIDQPGMRQ